MKRKLAVGRKSYSLKYKGDAVAYLDRNGMAQTCEYFGVGRTSLKHWIKDKESLRNAEHIASKSRHRLGNEGRPTMFPSDKVPVLINFINEQQEKHFKVTVKQLIALMKIIDEGSL